MELILLVIIVVLFVVDSRRRRRMAALEQRMDALEAALQAGVEPAETRQAAAAGSAATASAEPVGDDIENEVSPAAETPWGRPEPDRDAQPERPKAKSAGLNWEHLLGVRLPVWGGAALLVFAGLLFANYAMEQGFFSPAVRVWACGAGAVLFLLGALAVRWRRIANFERISAALAAAAIGLGYATCYLATAVFMFWPPVWGAMGCGVVALVAIGISLTFGQLVLILGLLGGYVAPGFVGVLPEGWPLLAYLTMVLAASHMVAAVRGWWNSALFSSGLALLWGLGWGILALDSGPSGESLPLALFILAIAMAPIAAELVVPVEDKPKIMRRDGPIAAASGAALLLILLGVVTLPGAPFWPAFVAWMAFLVAASLLRPRRWVFAAIAMGGLVVALVLWRDPAPAARIGVLAPGLLLTLGGAVLHIAAGRRQRLWAGAAMATLMVAILTSLVDFDGWAGARDVPGMWAAVCLVLAAGIVGLLIVLRGRDVAETVAPPLAAGASGLVSVAIGLLVDPGYYALSAALQVAGLGLVFWRYGTRTLLPLAMVYVAAYFGLVVFGHAMASDFAPALVGFPYAQFVPVLAVDAAPWTALVLPGCALLAGATFFSLRGAGRMVDGLDFLGILVVALGLHLVLVPLAGGEPVRNVFIYGALWFPIQLGLAAMALLVAARIGRPGLYWGGGLVAGLAGLALVGIAIVPLAELWPRMDIPGIAVFNLATVTLVAAIVLLLVIGRLVGRAGGDAGRPAGIGFRALAGIAAFAFMLVTIRHGFHPELLQGETSRVERYAYSGGMLAFAFALLWLGTWRDAQAVRVASLGVALATVAKLFVFDMGGLEGLWRIGSFLGLGLALLGVSWFYARFVFDMGRRPKDAEPPPEAEPDPA